MEDTYRAILNVDGDSLNAFYGVFDGHGGSKASSYAAEHMFSSISKQSLFRKIFIVRQKHEEPAISTFAAVPPVQNYATISRLFF